MYYDTYPLYHPPWPNDNDEEVQESYYIKAKKKIEYLTYKKDIQFKICFNYLPVSF